MVLRVNLAGAPEGRFREALLASDLEAISLCLDSSAPEWGGAELLVQGTPSAEELDALPRLETLVIPYAGLPRSTRELLIQRPSLRVYNLHHNAAPSSEHAIALLLAVARQLLPADAGLRERNWTLRYRASEASLLCGKRAIVVGTGAIGSRIHQVLSALGVQAEKIGRTELFAKGGPGSTRQRLRERLRGCQILMLAVPATSETEGLIGAEELAELDDSALLVNVGRASVLDEGALFDALVEKTMAGAGLDVWWSYPASEEEREDHAPASHPFESLTNVVMSPHVAGHCQETPELRAAALSELLRALARSEEPPGRVDPILGY